MYAKSLSKISLNHLRLVIKNRSRFLPIYLGRPKQAFPPLSIYLSVNSTCNAHCVMCDVGLKNRESQFYQNLVGPEADLSKDAIIKLLDEVAEFQPAIFISATEPLAYRPLFEVIKEIKRRGLFASITTNGILLKRNALKLIESGVDEIQVSLDGVGDLNDSIRGKGVFDRAASGIEEIKRLRGEAAVPAIKLNYVIFDLNCGGLYQFYNFFNDFGGIAAVSFSHLNYVSAEMAAAHNLRFGDLGFATAESLNVVNPKRVDAKLLASEVAKVKASTGELPVFFNPEISDEGEMLDFYNRPEKTFGQSMCRLPWVSMQIIADGSVTVSARCFGIKLGNINNQSFREIWHGGAYEKIRTQLYQHKKFPVCNRCCGVLS